MLLCTPVHVHVHNTIHVVQRLNVQQVATIGMKFTHMVLYMYSALT